MKIDYETLQKYKSISLEQANKSTHPLLGVWRIRFAANQKTISSKDAYYSIGDIVMVSIRRGATIDFVCASYFGDYGELSDQGPTHTVNFNGSSFWRFNKQPSNGGVYTGQLVGILGSTGNAEAFLSQDKRHLIIHEYPEPADGSTNESPRVNTTTRIVGGPLIERLEKGTISTIFLERTEI